MLHKKTLIATAIILLLAATHAEITFTDPKPDTIIQLSTIKGETVTLNITMQNTGPDTVQGISLQTDLNAEFTPPTFSLEKDQAKTIEFKKTVTKNENGSITTDTQSIHVRIIATEPESLIDTILDKMETNEKAISLFTQITMAVAVIAALILFAKIAAKGGN